MLIYWLQDLNMGNKPKYKLNMWKKANKNKEELNLGFWARVCVRILVVCVCVHTLRVCVHMHQACAHIHTQKPNPETQDKKKKQSKET